MKKFMRENGFTLLELVVAMAIFGGLVMALYAAIGAARRGARDTARKADLQAIEINIEDFYGAKVRYPETGEVRRINSGDEICVGGVAGTCNSSNGVITTLSMKTGSRAMKKRAGVSIEKDTGYCNCDDIGTNLAATKDVWTIGYYIDDADDAQNYCLVTRLENKQCYTILPQN